MASKPFQSRFLAHKNRSDYPKKWLFSPNFHTFISRYPLDANGVGLPDYSADIVLNKHIPDTLPICGKRVKVTYPGIPILCNRCWKLGHGHWECKDPNKTNWLELVADFYGNQRVTDEMLGTWVDALCKYHPLIRDQPNTNDARATQSTQGLHPTDLRRQIEREPYMRYEQTNQGRFHQNYQARYQQIPPQPLFHQPQIIPERYEVRQFRDTRPRGRGRQFQIQGQGQDRRQYRDPRAFVQGDFHATSYQRDPREFRDRRQ